MQSKENRRSDNAGVSACGEVMPNEGIALMRRRVDQSRTEEGHETTTYKMNWLLGRST